MDGNISLNHLSTPQKQPAPKVASSIGIWGIRVRLDPWYVACRVLWLLIAPLLTLPLFLREFVIMVKRVLEPLAKPAKKCRAADLDMVFDALIENCDGDVPFTEKASTGVVINLPGFAPFAVPTVPPDLKHLLQAWSRKSMPGADHGFSDQFIEFLSRRYMNHQDFLSIAEDEERDEISAFYHIINGFLDAHVDLIDELNCGFYRLLTSIHTWRHVDRSVTQQSANTQRIRDILKDNDNRELETQGDLFRDQGFTRLKALILTPTRHHCKVYVDNFLNLWPQKKVSGRQRLKREFGSNDAVDESRPVDWGHLFEGNADDDGIVGIQVRDTNLQLFSAPLESDVLVATPLAVRRLIGAEGELRRNYDFLSSVEIVVVDLADALVMQNWGHVEEVFKVLNVRPQSLGSVDIRRIKESVADGGAGALRQTILLSKYRQVEHSALFSRYCRNRRGYVSLATWAYGLLNTDDKYKTLKTHGVMHSFIGAQCRSPSTLIDDFRSYFVQNFLKGLHPRLRDRNENVLLVMPSYPDYLCLRKTLKSDRHCVGYRVIHEHSSLSSSNQSRTWFTKGECRLLIMTERYLYFRRPKLKAVQHVVFYGLPANASIFSDILDHLIARDRPTESLVLGYYSLADAEALQRLVGAEKAKSLVADVRFNL
ncbi:MAG: uncharacterized protein KVP18_004947 [Porospora cf. gigantea A]|uniref:uncharacterized protein n=2 Tax=Porospora cf. gigantea A TaxID=2853593 RepID=UPI0035598C90|nr:MAG: hypothetical protein KVP18_004947 [Porospora cf. gigantea A]